MRKTNRSIEGTYGQECGVQRKSVFRRVMGALASIALLLSLTMCETDYCNENMYVVGTLRAFHKESKSPIGVFLATVDDKGNPLSFVDATVGSYANFSLNPQSDTSRFYVLSSDTVVLSKIAIVHTNSTEFVNAECGIRTFSTIDTVLIEGAVEGDSVAILMKDVDENYDNGNIEIYLAGFE